MKKYGKRLLAVLISIVMVCSCFSVSVSAFWLDLATLVVSNLDAIISFADAVKVEPDVMMKNIAKEINSGSGGLWTGGTGLLSSESSRAETTADVLGYIAYDWNQRYAYSSIDFPCTVVNLRGSDGTIYTVIRLLPYGPAGSTADSQNKQWFLCDGSGRILCAAKDEASGTTAGGWVSVSKLKSPYHMLSLEGLYTIAKGEGGVLRQSGGMFFVQNSAGTQVLVASDGLAYAAWSNDDQTAINQNRPTSSGTVTDSAGNVTNIGGDLDYSTNIDMNGGTVTFPDGVVEELNSIIYDQSTKTYYVDSRDYSTTYNQSFSFYQYHINYTSVTYIGQTEEYNKYYEAYYELPDGRDSADLTKEDLEQLSTTFADVVNYARSTDNVDQRVLYHFDGDTMDSSYWSYTTKFDWTTGASLTYMDEGVFSGSLYLDETEHDFTISLPGNDAAGDFTLQFRYYQSYTAAPQTDSYIQIGDETLLSFSGAMYLDKNGAGITATSIGNWNEICIMRSSSVLYYYVNGVFYKSVEDSVYHKPTVRFYFGDAQQTYKKLDELRFTKGLVYTAGEDYTVSSVPFDSSLSLILPDGEFPLADEILVLTPSENNLLTAKGLDDWTVSDVVSNVTKYSRPSSWSKTQFSSAGVTLYRNTSYTTLTAGDGSVNLAVKGPVATTSYTPSNTTYGPEWMNLRNGLYLPIFEFMFDYSEDGSSFSSFSSAFTFEKSYTLTVVLSDGTYSSCTFVPTKTVNKYNWQGFDAITISKNVNSVVDFAVVDLYSESDSYYTDILHRYGIRIFPADGYTADIIHMEVVEGTEPQVQVGWETAMYSSGQLEESPVLAIRSNIDVSVYQIGGVRPSYPEPGQVYAMVESGYITSLQIYTGTGWENVDGRIWTGSRWIPASSYNVITLQDMYDIADATPDYEYIYTESGFWDWFQRAWKDLITRLDKIIEGMGGSTGGASACQHVYDSKIQREPTCTEPGHKVYTCSICGHAYMELIDALGHDWVVTDSVPDVLDENGSIIEEGYDELTCSRCDLTAKDFGDGPQETDLFDALGDLIADGITWVLDKLTELVEALTGITDSFNSFVERVGALAGVFPMFFGAFFALIPEDLTTVLWFGVIAFIVLAVWRKWSK